MWKHSDEATGKLCNEYGHNESRVGDFSRSEKVVEFHHVTVSLKILSRFFTETEQEVPGTGQITQPFKQSVFSESLSQSS